MFVLHPLKELEDGVHDGVPDHSQLWLKVALPPANLLEDELAEDREGAVVIGVSDQPPLVVGQVSPSCLHPQLDRGRYVGTYIKYIISNISYI